MNQSPRPYPANPVTLPPGWQPMTFGAAIRAACARDPYKTALVCGARSRIRVGQSPVCEAPGRVYDNLAYVIA